MRFKDMQIFLSKDLRMQSALVILKSGLFFLFYFSLHLQHIYLICL